MSKAKKTEALGARLKRFKEAGGRIMEVVYPEQGDYESRDEFDVVARELRDKLGEKGYEIAQEAITLFLGNNGLLLALDKTEGILGVLSYDEEVGERWITELETFAAHSGAGTALVCAAAGESEFGRLSVKAYDNAVAFYQDQLGMSVLKQESDDSLAKLGWSEKESMAAQAAFKESGLEVEQRFSLSELEVGNEGQQADKTLD